jgi:uncharacterized protein with HEPN domain
MFERPVKLLLVDIIESCEKIEQYTAGKELHDMMNNSMMQDAIERNIEIIGAVCAKLPKEFISALPSIEWKKAIGMRNRLIHGHFATDIILLWNTAKNYSRF